MLRAGLGKGRTSGEEERQRVLFGTGLGAEDRLSTRLCAQPESLAAGSGAPTVAAAQ